MAEQPQAGAMPGNIITCVQAESILAEARLGFHSPSEEAARSSLVGFEGILAVATGLCWTCFGPGR